MDTDTLASFGLVVLFVIVGGVFAATEIALVSLRDSQLTQLERQGARGARVAAVARNPNRFLAAVQIGVTVAGFFSAAYGGSTLAPDLAPYLQRLGLSESAAATTALLAMTLLIAYLSLVLGELVPKRLALQNSAGLSLLATPSLDRFATVMRPVIWLLSVSTNALVRLLGGDPEATREELSERELRDLVATHDGLEDDERQIIQDVLGAAQTLLREAMRPRTDVVFIDADMPLRDAAPWARRQGFSRYPVIGEGFDDVLGYLHARDLIDLRVDETRRVHDVIREVLVLPGTNRVLPAVSQMRHAGTHLAVVVDEYGGTDGIVTLEDLVEELVGDIRDEYDARPAPSMQDPSIVPGSSTLEEFAEATGVELPDDGSYETVAGYVIARLGRIAAVGDTVAVDDHTLAVTRMTGTRITELAWHPAEPQPPVPPA
ncbi:hemolysin family protein [Pseudactinotalea sp. HY158]|uniref:hemolysin family protein n=1 Tax=Pseudactinotalea sp. HY158 TaxID=2654547 RepID=UPI00129C756F|nr:hemolysin family protein [Pseudactinotalea sp. HY158]QGH70018.1 DUF21 domain-containing protein [Pseudactinotalea sp. HY158]